LHKYLLLFDQYIFTYIYIYIYTSLKRLLFIITFKFNLLSFAAQSNRSKITVQWRYPDYRNLRHIFRFIGQSQRSLSFHNPVFRD